MAASIVAAGKPMMPESEQLPESSKKEAPRKGLFNCQEGTRQENETVTFYHDFAGLTLFPVANLLGTIYRTSGDDQTALRCNKDNDQWQ